MPKIITTEDFIRRAIEKHGDKYDYKNTEYKGSRSNITITCKKHNVSFLQSAHHHLSGKGGCKICASNTNRSNAETFIKRAMEIHNQKYDYSNVVYENNEKRVCIICDKHGEFWQSPGNHISGRGCPECAKITIGRQKISNTKDFIHKAMEKHGNLYNYSVVEYKNSREVVDIICPEHGTFRQTPNLHLCGSGCPKCIKQSSGETFIRKFLESNNIKFIEQVKFPTCRHIKLLSFDFLIEGKNVLIEYDGEQHFKPVKYFGGNVKFEYRKKLDSIKSEWAKNNRYNLVRIPYDMSHNDIVEKLYNTLVFSA